MSFTLPDLPDDVDSLRAIIAAQALQLHSRDILIEKMRAQLAALRRARFGQSSEKVEREIAQLELALEEIEATDAATMPSLPAAPTREEKGKPARQPLPDHLLREEVVHEVGARVSDQPVQILQCRKINPRRSHRHAHTDHRIDHPPGDRNDELCWARDMKNQTRRAVFDATNEHLLAKVRVPAVMNFDFFADMGRMNG